MRKISYLPSKDEMLLEFFPIKKRPTKKIGHYKLWLDEEGTIRALAIMSYTAEFKEFKRNRGTAQLGGIWKGVRITDEDIKKARQDLLKRLEEKW